MKLWDIRSKQIVYELATGNNSVNTVIWNARNTTLYAATACEWQDHLGYFHGYRRARPEVAIGANMGSTIGFFTAL